MLALETANTSVRPRHFDICNALRERMTACAAVLSVVYPSPCQTAISWLPLGALAFFYHTVDPADYTYPETRCTTCIHLFFVDAHIELHHPSPRARLPVQSAHCTLSISARTLNTCARQESGLTAILNSFSCGTSSQLKPPDRALSSDATPPTLIWLMSAMVSDTYLWQCLNLLGRPSATAYSEYRPHRPISTPDPYSTSRSPPWIYPPGI